MKDSSTSPLSEFCWRKFLSQLVPAALTLSVWLTCPVPLVGATINVAGYGATPNDASDDATAINNALNASAPGDTISFPPGVYTLSNTLTLKPDRAYNGGGTLKLTNTSKFALQTQWDAGKNIQLENLTVDGGGISFAGSGRVNATNINIRNCTFKNVNHPDYPYYNTIYIPIGARNCAFTGNVFTNVAGGFAGWNLYGCQINDNWFDSVGQGISIQGHGASVAVLRNTGVRLHRMGIEFQCIDGTAPNSVVEDNHFSNWVKPFCDSFGLSIVPPRGPNISVRYNTLLARPPVPGTWENRFGYGIEAANDTLCRDNFVEGHWWVGISIGGGNSIITNNVCRGPHDGQFKTPATIAFESGGDPATVTITNNRLTVTGSYIEHPHHLRANASTNRVDLAWADNSGNESGFKVERRAPGGDYSLLATLPVNATAYSDTNVVPNTQFVYRIHAFNTSGDETYSPALLVATPASEASSGRLQRSAAPPEPTQRRIEPREFYGAKLEPVNHVLHGAGQSEWEAVDRYSRTLGVAPVVYMDYTDAKSSNPSRYVQKLQERLSHFKHFTAVQLGLSMTDGQSRNYEQDVAAGKYDVNLNTLFRDLKKLNAPIYVRIGYECNGGHNGYQPETYKGAFAHVTRLLRASGLDAATVWCVDTGKLDQMMPYYPGDEWVDWWGVDLFPVWFIKDCGPFLNEARVHRKPVMIGESTPCKLGVLEGQKNWDEWFKPYFDLIGSNPGIKAFCYINWNWARFPQWKDWGDARLEANPVVAELYRREMASGLYLHGSTRLAFDQARRGAEKR